jgi:hypothetical protein
MNPPDSLTRRRTQLRAELIGDDACAVLGVTIHSVTPVLATCRELLDQGHNPATRLHCYRGDILALAVRSIGEGAALSVNSKGSGFIRCPRSVRIASPVDRQVKDDAAPTFAGAAP